MKIANIPIAVIVDGQRKVIPVGGEIPASMAAHDVQMLTASGAVCDVDAAVEAELAQAVAQRQADAQFQAARKAAQAAAQSTQPAEPPAEPSGKAPAKSTAKPRK
jgi:hypothetical protein